MDMTHGNTVGSRGSLTVQQSAILVGKILGDGCLEKNGNHVRLRIEQSEKQKEYVEWLFKKLQFFVSKPPYSLLHTGFGGKKTRRWRFSTRSLEIFDHYFDAFYSKSKCIPENVEKYFVDPVMLAVWYMDDGYMRTDHSGAYLCTSSFTFGEHQLLRQAIWKVYCVETSVHFAGKYPRLHIPSKYLKQFMNIVEPNIIDCFRYKLSLTP